MVQPIGQSLGGNPAGGTVFHQTHIMNVWHFRAANAAINPTHNISKNALCIVFNLLCQLIRRPIGASRHWNGQKLIQAPTRAFNFQVVLYGHHVNLMIMGCVQGGSSGARHPSAGCARFGVTNLLSQHIAHQVWHGPHALADLSLALQSAGQSDINIAIFIGVDPRGHFHLTFGDHWASFHGRVDLITRAVQEPCIDEGHPRLCGMDTGF